MKIITGIAAPATAVSVPAQAQLRSLNDATKAMVWEPMQIECGTAFHHGEDSVDFINPSGHETTVTIDRAAQQFIVIRDGQKWVGSFDTTGGFRLVDPQGRVKVRVPLSRADALLYARTMHQQMLAFTSPCQSVVPSAPKCLNNNGYATPAPGAGGPGPFSGLPPEQTKDCIPDIFGDSGYWASTFESDYFGPVLDQFSFDASTQCQAAKSGCMNNCNNAVTQAMVVCAGAGEIPAAAAACVAGAYLGGLWCQSGCNSDYPNC